MDERSLSDSVILAAMKAGNGTATVKSKHGPFSLTRASMERPFEFLQRYRREFGAWYNEQEYQASSQARAVRDSLREADNGPSPATPALPQAVQTTEASLGATISAKINELHSRCDRLQKQYETAKWSAEDFLARLTAARFELEKAEKFLKELEEDGSTPTVSQTMGADIHSEVGQRKSRSSRRVGPKNGPEVGGKQGESGDAKDTGSEAVA